MASETKLRYLFLAGIFLLSVIQLSSSELYRGDDAYIPLRYAKNLVATGELTWNPGHEKVDGYTSFLHVIFLSFFYYLGCNLFNLLTYSNIVFYLLTLLVMYWYGESSGWRAISYLPLLLLISVGELNKWCNNGLETSFYILLFTSSILLAIRRFDDLKFYNYVLFTATILTRFESAVVVIFLLLLYLVNIRSDRHKVKRTAINFFFILLLPLIAYFLWHTSYYGYPLPNTYYVKMASSRWLELRDGFKYFESFLHQYKGIYIIPILILFFLRAPRNYFKDLPMLILFSVSLLYILVVIYEGGDCQYGARFFLPICPLIFLMIGHYIHLHKKFILDHKRSSVILLIVFLISYFYLIDIGRGATKSFENIENQYWPVLERGYTDGISKFLTKIINRKYSVGQSDFQRLGYYSDLVILDAHGLNDKTIAHKEARNPTKWGKFDIRNVIQQQPDIYLLSTEIRPFRKKIDEHTLDTISYQEFHSLFGYSHEDLDNPLHDKSGWRQFRSMYKVINVMNPWSPARLYIPLFILREKSAEIEESLSSYLSNS